MSLVDTDIIPVMGDDVSFISDVTDFLDEENNTELAAKATATLGVTQKGLLGGREEELDLLQTVFSRITEPNASSELFLLHGPSGVGKSVLVESLRATCMSGNHNDESSTEYYYIVSGKFDQYLKREPFSAIVAAFSEILELLSQRREDDVAAISAAFRAELSENELQQLSCFVSNLSHILNTTTTTATASTTAEPELYGLSPTTTTTMKHYQAFDGFKLLCQKFLRIVSKFASGICIFLDDLQWAEQESLQVLTSLCMDVESKNILLVGAYREDGVETQEDDKTENLLQEFLKQDFKLERTELHLENLTADGVYDLMDVLLNGQEEEEDDDEDWELEPELEDEPDQMMEDESDQHEASEEQQQHQQELQMDEALPLEERPQDVDTEEPVERELQDQQSASVDEQEQQQPEEGEEEPEQDFVVDEKLQALSELVYARTMGNPYHAVQFLQTLQRNSLLTKDEEGDVWVWDLERVQAETSVSENVAELILSKITRLHAFVQGMLKLGACLGFQFDADLLKTIALAQIPQQNRAKMADVYSKRIDQALGLAIREGLCESCGVEGGGDNKTTTTTIKFTHDRVQQALYSLFSKKELPQLHLRIGLLLQEQLLQQHGADGEPGDDSMLFLTAEQLNLGLGLVQPEQYVGIAKLNLAASRVAMSKSAFQAATDYIQLASDLLKDRWDQDYDLTLKVFTTCAQYNCCTGRFDESNKASETVLEHAKTIVDKMPVYYTMIDALGSQDLLTDALDLGNRILNEELKVKTPRRAHPGQIVMELARVTKLVGKKTDDDFLNAPPVSDDKKAAAMCMSIALSMIAFFAQENLNYPFLWLRAMKLTLMYGQDRITAPIFACYGSVNSFMGRYVAAHRFGMLARKLIQKTQAWDDEAVTETLINSFSSHWKLPLTHQIPYYDKAYRVGMATGNTNFAVLADISRVETNFAIGANLVQLEKECARSCNLLIALNKRTLMKACLPIWQCVLNLQGKCDDPLILSGDAMDEDEIIDEECETGFDLAMSNAHQLKMSLACLFQEWEDCYEAAKIMKSHPEIYLAISAHYFSLSFTLFSGVAYFNLARQSSAFWRRHYLRAARKNLRRTNKWVKIGCPDAMPIQAMLAAEQTVLELASSKSKKRRNAAVSTIQRHYDEAIDKCAHARHLHYQAFSHERCGTVLLEMNEPEPATTYLHQAMELYEAWGAIAKVDQIKERMAKNGLSLVPSGDKGGSVKANTSITSSLGKATANISNESTAQPSAASTIPMQIGTIDGEEKSEVTEKISDDTSSAALTSNVSANSGSTLTSDPAVNNKVLVAQ